MLPLELHDCQLTWVKYVNLTCIFPSQGFWSACESETLPWEDVRLADLHNNSWKPICQNRKGFFLSIINRSSSDFQLRSGAAWDISDISWCYRRSLDSHITDLHGLYTYLRSPSDDTCTIDLHAPQETWLETLVLQTCTHCDILQKSSSSCLNNQQSLPTSGQLDAICKGHTVDQLSNLPWLGIIDQDSAKYKGLLIIQQ